MSKVPRLGSYGEDLSKLGVDVPGQEGGGSSRRPLEEWSEREMVDRQNKWFQRVTDDRRHIERQALLGTAFLMDQQYVDFVGSSGSAKLSEVPAKKGRVRTIEQIIEPAYRAEMARLLRNRPQGTTVPDGLDAEDHEAAQAADDLLAHCWREYEAPAYIEEAVGWQVAGGTSAIHTGWDPNEPDPDGVPGSFVFRALSPFQFGVPNIREQHLSNQPYVMVTKVLSLDEIEDQWGQRVTADHAGSYGSLDHRLASVISGGTRSGEQDDEQAVVKETWIKPSKIAPAGAVLITSGDKLLDLQTWPKWCNGQYPFDLLRYTPVPGAFWGKSLLQALIPIQRRHNRAASINIEVLNLLSQMAVAVPRGSQVRSLMGDRGLMIESPPGATQPVTNVQTPPVGDLPFNELEHTRLAARDIASQHEVTKGFTPPNVRSGTAISMLKEMDDSASATPLRYIERAVQGMGRNMLGIVKQHWQEPRMIRVIGKAGELERRSFIAGDSIGGQYQVVEGSSWPYTKAEQQAYMLQLHDRGVITDDELMQRLDQGAVRGIQEEREIDYREARLENQKLEALEVTLADDGRVVLDGEVPQPQDWQNHMVHLETHLRQKKTPQYLTWNPMKQMAHDAHIIGHKAALYSQMQMQPGMAEQPGMEGAPQQPPAQDPNKPPPAPAGGGEGPENPEATIENPEDDDGEGALQ